MEPAAQWLEAGLGRRYRIDREIGAGSGGTVFLAFDHKHQRPVAIKILPPELALAIGEERFQREIAVVAQLSHPHIVPLLDSGVIRGFPYYVMPFVAGETLRSRLEREGPLPVDEVCKLAMELAGALHHAHERGVVHRDVRPENILLAEGNPLLSDFSVAGWAKPRAALPLTDPGVTVGSPSYASPEQLRGEASVDRRADVYSLACVAYEALTGEPPFTGATGHIVVRRVLSENPRPIRATRDTVPKGLARAVELGLEKTPAARFASAADFGAAIERGTRFSGTGPLSTRLRTATMVGLGVVATIAVLWARLNGDRTPPDPVRIAVLPLTPPTDSGDRELGRALASQIATRLSGIPSLAVIATTSTRDLDGQSPDTALLRRDLGADFVVTGSFLRLPKDSATRIALRILRLPGGATVRHDTLYASARDMAALPGRAARSVTEGIGLPIRDAEQRLGLGAGTNNPRAYEYFLHGLEFLDGSWETPAKASTAVGLFGEAVRADSAFAEAHAGLALAQIVVYRFVDYQPEILSRARQEVETGLRLAPELPEAHIAAGFYQYWGEANYDGAATEFLAAVRRQPANSAALWGLGLVERRQNRFAQARDHLTRAADLDPGSRDKAWDAGGILHELRMYDSAVRYYDRMIQLAPDRPLGYARLAELRLSASGDLGGAREILHRAMAKVSLDELYGAIAFGPGFLLTLDEPSDTGLNRRLTRFFTSDSTNDLWRADYCSDRRLRDCTLQLSNTIRVGFEEFLRNKATHPAPHPNDYVIHAILARANARLGRREAALEQLRQSEAALPEAKDAAVAATRRYWAAQIYAWLGESDHAIDQLEYLLAIPSKISVALLRAEPGFASLRSHPRFQRLVERSPPRRQPPPLIEPLPASTR